MAKKKPVQDQSQSNPDRPQLYWKNPTHLVGKGTVIGRCEDEDLEAFRASTSSIPGFNLEKWVTTDPPQTKVKRMIS